MGTKLSNLTPPIGAKHRRKRVGRGVGSGSGTTAGRGEKGQGSRSGHDLGRGFEGGQMPLQRRLPKKGFKNHTRIEYAPINIGRLAEVFNAGEVIDPAKMRSSGVVARNAIRMKVLGEGELPHKLTIKAHAFSKSAIEKITAAGGIAEVLPLKQVVKTDIAES